MSTEPATGSSAPPPERITYASIEEWRAEGERRFGQDIFRWRYVCPACGHVQAIEDFRPYKDRGATADTARGSCIGRFAGTTRRAFGGSGPGPCDYTACGLLNICPVTVMLDGKAIPCFAFDEPDPR